jgi:RHS repeat-associated protein
MRWNRNTTCWDASRGGMLSVGHSSTLSCIVLVVYLRARWYHTGQARFVSRDPWAGDDTEPYSFHAYQYGYSNPVLYTDPSGNCAKRATGTDQCWTRWKWAVQTLGFTPKGLDSWDAFELDNLLGWLRDGITFTRDANRLWQAGVMKEVLEALTRVEFALDHNHAKTKAILGLNNHRLDIKLFQAQFNTAIPNSRGGAEADTTHGQFIKLYRINAGEVNESGIQGIVHEVGHLLDLNARQFVAGGSEGLWSQVIGGSWATASGWTYSCPHWSLTAQGIKGAVSQYATEGKRGVLHDPHETPPLIEEDFAETFNWFVESANKKTFLPSGGPEFINSENISSNHMTPNDERIRAIKDLLARF